MTDKFKILALGSINFEKRPFAASIMSKIALVGYRPEIIKK